MCIRDRLNGDIDDNVLIDNEYAPSRSLRMTRKLTESEDQRAKELAEKNKVKGSENTQDVDQDVVETESAKQKRLEQEALDKKKLEDDQNVLESESQKQKKLQEGQSENVLETESQKQKRLDEEGLSENVLETESQKQKKLDEVNEDVVETESQKQKKLEQDALSQNSLETESEKQKRLDQEALDKENQDLSETESEKQKRLDQEGLSENVSETKSEKQKRLEQEGISENVSESESEKQKRLEQEALNQDVNEDIIDDEVENNSVNDDSEKDQEGEDKPEFSEWSEDKDNHGDRFGEYDEERQEIMRSLLLRIKLVFEENKEKIELIPEDLIITMSDDNYLEFRLPGYKYYVMHLTLEYKEKSGKHYALMNSDDFVDKSRSVLYISEKRLEDQIQHLAGHLESFVGFFFEHVNNRREFEELEDRLEQYLRERFEYKFGQFEKVIDTPNYKRIEVSVDGENLKNGTPMTNQFSIIIYKLDSKHFMIDMKGEIREMSMIVKIFLSDEEFDKMIKKIVHTAYENNQQEFSWKAVPQMIISVLDVLKAEENTGDQGGLYLQVERVGDEGEFGPDNNTIQYKVMHIPGDDEDSDEEIIMNINCYLFKDEFLPSIYFNVDSKVYQSEYLVPFIAPSAEFSMMMLESVKKAYNTIKKIIYDLADIDEQDVYTYDHDQIVNIIKDGISEFEICEKDDIKTVEVLDTEYDGIPFKEEKIFHNPKMYFTIHNIEMEEERTGFLVNCYNLKTTKGDVGEYRIYETNYYDCKDDFANFVRTCVVE